MSVASVKAVPKAPIEVAKQIAPVETNAGVRAGSVTSKGSARSRPQRAGGFFVHGVDLFCGRHHGRDDAGNRKVHVAGEAPAIP